MWRWLKNRTSTMTYLKAYSKSKIIIIKIIYNEMTGLDSTLPTDKCKSRQPHKTTSRYLKTSDIFLLISILSTFGKDG